MLSSLINTFWRFDDLKASKSTKRKLFELIWKQIRLKADLLFIYSIARPEKWKYKPPNELFPSAKTSLRLRWIHREIITVFWISPLITTSMYSTFRFEMSVSLEPCFIFPGAAVIFVRTLLARKNLANIELHWHWLAQCICCICKFTNVEDSLS